MTEVCQTVDQVREWRALLDARVVAVETRLAEVGFVPTMGFLHEGHLSLVRRAAAENDAVVASIFVNPSQFDRADDLANYPRDLERDLELLTGAGCHMAFVPASGEMYPPGYQTWIEVGPVALPLEGRHRPGHFRGVATVVAKLFGIVEPARAYFGRKDAQQLAVIKTMVRDLNIPVDVIGCPTAREPDGLAMSSRNSRLGPTERAAAPVLHRALVAARDAWQAGETDADRLREVMQAVLDAEPLAEAEYVSVADPVSLDELDDATAGALLSMAAQVGPVRLIDNLVLEPPESALGAGDVYAETSGGVDPTHDEPTHREPEDSDSSHDEPRLARDATDSAR